MIDWLDWFALGFKWAMIDWLDWFALGFALIVIAWVVFITICSFAYLGACVWGWWVRNES